MSLMKRRDKLLLLLLVTNIPITTLVVMFFPSSSEFSSTDGYLFTFAHITDSQFSGSSAIFEKATSWLAQQENLAFVVHTGDIVSNPFDETAWRNAYEYMHQLDESCSWAVLAGDNDVLYWRGVDLTNYEKHLGNNSTDQYYIVGDKLLFILLSWNNVDGSISEERLEWMDEIIQEHDELYVVVCLHPYLYGYPFLNIMIAPNADEIWTHIDKFENVIMTLSGHIHRSWIRIHTNGESEVWSISTEALIEKGAIRLFDVYEDSIVSYVYSPWTNQEYTGTLDRFTIELNPNSHDVDGDLWRDDLDMMPTHPLIPNGAITSLTVTTAILAYLVKGRYTAS
jgi:hypothetical protein